MNFFKGIYPVCGWGLLLLAVLCLPGSGYAQASKFCNLKGGVYVEKNPAQAQYRVFIDESEAFADLSIFKAQNLLFADRGGLWYFTDTKAQAAFIIAYVDRKDMADFSIFFIENESFAGCK